MAITLLYTFVPRTTALSSEVNANFALLASRAVDKAGDTLTGTLLTQSLVPNVSATYDLGSTTAFYRTLYLRTSILLEQTNGYYNIVWTNPPTARTLTLTDPQGNDEFVFANAIQTLDHKTILDPAINGSITGTYVLNGTVSLNNPSVTHNLLITGADDNSGLTITSTGVTRPTIHFNNDTTGMLGAISATDDQQLRLYAGGDSSLVFVGHPSGGVSFGNAVDPGVDHVSVAGDLVVGGALTVTSTVTAGTAQLVNGAGSPSFVIAGVGSYGAGQPGALLIAGNNTFGGGAAGTVKLYDKAGVGHYLWIDAVGKLRLGPDAPTETGGISDTSGVIVGGQS